MHPLTFVCAAWGFMLTAAAIIHIVAFFVATMQYAASDYLQSYWVSLEGLFQTAIDSEIYRRPTENLMHGISWFGVAASVEYAARILSETRRLGRRGVIHRNRVNP